MNYTKWPGSVKYKFDKSDSLTETFSQAFQEIFVLSVLNGKTNGTYLEIGCNVPDYTNNTYLLARDFGWNGVSLDWEKELATKWTAQRPTNTFIAANAVTADYKKILADQFGDQRVIDYLQVDVEPPMVTLEALTKLPHEEYRFKVITFETDYYTGKEGELVRQYSRELLSKLGYDLIAGDVIVDGKNPYEDWWVDMNLVDRDVANSIRSQCVYEQRPEKFLFL
jgi:hypothetical protein